MKTQVFGIPNCSTVKKARDWLESRSISYDFQDFKKIQLNKALIEEWLSQTSIELLINRKGTTWRGLTDLQKDSPNTKSGAIQLMIDKPSVIKRPVTLYNGKITVGFTPENYESLFKK